MQTVQEAPTTATIAKKMLWGVPVRDLVIIPLLSLLTVVVMLATSEIVTRAIWPESAVDPCVVFSPADTNIKKICRSRTKLVEGTWVDNYYNDCGYRTRESCGPKKTGTMRVAVVGSSSSYGYMTPYEQAYPALTSAALTRQCKRPVEFQNTGRPLIKMINVYQHFDEALAMKPDAAIFAFSPYDVQMNDLTSEQREHLETAPLTPQTPLTTVPQNNPLKRYVLLPIKQSRTMYMLQHQLYQDPVTYSQLYLLYGDNAAGYLSQSLSPTWQVRFQNLDAIIAGLAKKAQAASVPLIIFTVPSAAQVALANAPAHAGKDPANFARQVREIAARHGVQVIDALPQMAHQPQPMSQFFVVDGHVGAAGEARMALALDSGLTSGSFPAFDGCSAQ
jgi:hypothetical protein